MLSPRCAGDVAFEMLPVKLDLNGSSVYSLDFECARLASLAYLVFILVCVELYSDMPGWCSRGMPACLW